MRLLEQVVDKAIGRRHGRLLVAVSGGADSVALLHVLLRLRKDCIVAHCNFHLRGEESDRDERHVVDLCASHGVELLVKHFDVAAYCARHKVSVEMACRDLRYEWFRQLMADRECSRIAVAHNSDDNVETMLLNLFRGTGIDGLAAMAVDNGEILRPLLGVTRRQIEEYLRECGIEYVVDSTNLESDYRRNFVRNELLPMIETRWPGARSALARTRQNLEGARRFYRAKVDEMLICCDNADFLPNEIVTDAPDKVTLLHEFLKRHGISDEIAVEMADSWASSEGIGKRWLTAEAEIVLDREGFRLLPVGQVVAEPTLKIERLAMTDRLMMQIRSDRSQSVCYLPADEIDETKFEENYRLRQPMRGDRIAPIGMKGSSLVSDVLKDAKLTIPERRNYFLLEQVSTGEIIWMPGLKRSRHALVSPTDVAVCRISLDKI